MTLGIVVLLALNSPVESTAASALPGASDSIVRIDVHAPAGCSSRGALAARVTARSPRIRFAGERATWAVKATVAPVRPGEVVGELTVLEAGKRVVSRRLLAQSCDEATDALALIVSVTLDPTSAAENATAATQSPASDARRSAETMPAAALPPNPISEPSPKEAPPQPSEPNPGQRREERDERQPKEPVAETAVAEAPESAMQRILAIHLAGQTVLGPAPALMPGVALYASVAFDRSPLWSPALILGLVHAWRSGLGQQGGSASFQLDALTLDACVPRFGHQRIQGRLCASVLAGRMVASGSDTTAAATQARPFVSVGGSAVVSGRVASMVELSLRLAMGATLIRDSYEFAPTTFYQASGMTTLVSLGIGLRSPSHP